MNPVSFAVKHLHVVLVLVALLVLTGAYSLWTLSAQLLPDAENNSLNIHANWGSAAPEEMESEVAEPITSVLKGLNGLKNTFAEIQTGDFGVWLNFAPGTDMKETRLEVVNRLSQITGLPNDLDGPRVTQWKRNGTLINLFLKKTDGSMFNEKDSDLVTTRVEAAFHAIPGISRIQVSGLPDTRIEVRFDPAKLAMYRLTLQELSDKALPGQDVTAGSVEIGRRVYKLRYASGYSLEQFNQRLIAWRDGKPVRLGDVAEVVRSETPRSNYTLQNGNPAVGVRLFRSADVNVLKAHARVKEVMEELNRQWLIPNDMLISPSYDPSVFIKRALWMVGGSLGIGMLLAIFGLWLFVHQWRPTLIIGLSIPLSLLAAIIVLKVSGGTLNVISLAGLAFTVGMVMDAAIVVMESILREKEKEKEKEKGESDPQAASVRGTLRIWSALLASTVTTVVVFLPVLWLEGAEGALFADLALTISAGVMASMLIAVLVLPVLASHYLQAIKVSADGRLRHRFALWMMHLTDRGWKRILVVVMFLGLPLIISQWSLPQVDFLPGIKAETVAASFRTTSGISPTTYWNEMKPKIVERIAPYLSGEKEPAVKNYYFFVGNGNPLLGLRAQDPKKIPLLKEKIQKEFSVGFPDAQPFVFRMDLMNDEVGGSRGVGLVLQSSDLKALYTAADEVKQLLSDAFGGAEVYPNPQTSLTALEMRIHPDDRRLAEVGWNREDLSTVIASLGSGTYLGEFYDGNTSLPVILKSSSEVYPELLESQPLVTPAGPIMQLGELTHLETLLGPDRVIQRDGRRSVSLRMVLPQEISLQEAVTRIETELFPKIDALLPEDGRILLDSQASDLNQALKNLASILAFGLLILLILLLGLFRSLWDALTVLLTLPLASLGGVLALQVLTSVTGKNVDLLALIGFVILLGLVVNNSILIVFEARTARNQGMSTDDAVTHAIETRLRPILMTTLTSVAGMLPLLLSPATGAEIYRGLSAVIVGGMTFSALFILILLPALLRFGSSEQKQLISANPSNIQQTTV